MSCLKKQKCPVATLAALPLFPLTSPPFPSPYSEKFSGLGQGRSESAPMRRNAVEHGTTHRMLLCLTCTGRVRGLCHRTPEEKSQLETWQSESKFPPDEWCSALSETPTHTARQFSKRVYRSSNMGGLWRCHNQRTGAHGSMLVTPTSHGPDMPTRLIIYTTQVLRGISPKDKELGSVHRRPHEWQADGPTVCTQCYMDAKKVFCQLGPSCCEPHMVLWTLCPAPWNICTVLKEAVTLPCEHTSSFLIKILTKRGGGLNVTCRPVVANLCRAIFCVSRATIQKFI